MASPKPVPWVEKLVEKGFEQLVEMVQLFFAQPLAGIPDEQRCCTVAGCEFDAETPSRRGVMNGVAEQILESVR